MNSKPTVSVVMNCYNSDTYLNEAIDSVYAQTFTDWEIIFWDNQSIDNSAKIAQSYDNKLYYYRGAEFVPLGHARNLALDKCQGQYIAFLDCDDIWYSDKLEKQIALFDTYPQLGLVYSNCDLMDSQGKVFGKYFSNYSQDIPARGFILETLLINSCFIPLLSVLIRQDIFNTIGKFDLHYNIVEDYDLWLKCAAQYEIDYILDPLCSYRSHDSNTSKLQSERSQTEYLELLYSWIYQNRFSLKNKTLIENRYVFCLLIFFLWMIRQPNRRYEAILFFINNVKNTPQLIRHPKAWLEVFIHTLKQIFKKSQRTDFT